MWASRIGVDGCAEAATALAEKSRTIQMDDGRFVTHPSDQETMVHPHLYAVEGLYVLGSATGDADVLERAAKATAWAWEHQGPAGALPRWVVSSSGGRGPDQSDLTAQALRAAVLLDVAPGRRKATVDWLTDTAFRNADGTVAAVYQPGSGTTHLSTWSTFFAVQALNLYLEGQDAVTWRTLV